MSKRSKTLGPVETKIVLSAREYTDRELCHSNALHRARYKSQRREHRTFRLYMRERLESLNGEAGRLKTILDSSVASEKFNQYVQTQQEKLEQADKASRQAFESYVTTTRNEFRAYTESQGIAFRNFSEDISKRLAVVNVRLATWAGGLTALLLFVQFWLRYK